VDGDIKRGRASSVKIVDVIKPPVNEQDIAV
jgi:hypothetical protein